MDAVAICWNGIVQAVVLLIAANGAPVIAGKLFGKHGAHPIDSGLLLGDAQPLFGASKTWRGLAAGIILPAATAALLGLPPSLGALFGLISLCGDLIASFIKRRLAYAPSTRARLLDVPLEALLPVAALHTPLKIGSFEVVIAAAAFFLLEALFSPLLYRWHIRNRPY